MELTRVEKKSLPASLFQVPAGYKQTDTAIGGLSPEQEKAMRDARSQMDEAMKNMTPEQRKAVEDAMKRYGQPTPVPRGWIECGVWLRSSASAPRRLSPAGVTRARRSSSIRRTVATSWAWSSEEFERAHPDVDVRWLDMGSQEVYDRVRSEKANPQADVWFGGPDTIFSRGAKEGLLAAVPARVGRRRRARQPPRRRSLLRPLPHAGRCWSTTPRPISSGAGAARLGRPARPEVEGKDPDPRSDRLRHHAHGLRLRSWRNRCAETGSTDAGFAWLRRLDAQTKEYVSNPILLYEKIVRGEGQSTIWELTDTLLERQKRLAAPVRLPDERHAGDRRRGRRSSRDAGTRRALEAFVDFVGSRRSRRSPPRRRSACRRAPTSATRCPRGRATSSATWRPRRSTGTWSTREGARWMATWDRTVRGKGAAPEVALGSGSRQAPFGLRYLPPPRCPSFSASSRSRSASGRSPSRAASRSRRRRARSWRSSGPRAAARRRCCAWSPASSRPTPADPRGRRGRDARCRPSAATSAWSSSTTRSSRT